MKVRTFIYSLFVTYRKRFAGKMNIDNNNNDNSNNNNKYD